MKDKTIMNLKRFADVLFVLFLIFLAIWVVLKILYFSIFGGAIATTMILFFILFRIATNDEW